MPAAVEHRSRGVEHGVRARLTAGDDRRRGIQCPIQRRRSLARHRIEIGVARAHRQAVGLAHDRARHDADRDVEIAHEPPDDEHLLRVLLAEVGRIGGDDLQQLGDDGRDPVEVAGPAVRTAQHFGDARDVDAGGEPVRVDLLDGRGEEDVGARVAGQRGVRSSLRGYAPRSSFAPNWVGLTNSDTMTRSVSVRACRTRER